MMHIAWGRLGMSHARILRILAKCTLWRKWVRISYPGWGLLGIHWHFKFVPCHCRHTLVWAVLLDTHAFLAYVLSTRHVPLPLREDVLACADPDAKQVRVTGYRIASIPPLPLPDLPHIFLPLFRRPRTRRPACCCPPDAERSCPSPRPPSPFAPSPHSQPHPHPHQRPSQPWKPTKGGRRRRPRTPPRGRRPWSGATSTESTLGIGTWWHHASPIRSSFGTCAVRRGGGRDWPPPRPWPIGAWSSWPPIPTAWSGTGSPRRAIGTGSGSGATGRRPGRGPGGAEGSSREVPRSRWGDTPGSWSSWGRGRRPRSGSRWCTAPSPSGSCRSSARGHETRGRVEHFFNVYYLHSWLVEYTSFFNI